MTEVARPPRSFAVISFAMGMLGALLLVMTLIRAPLVITPEIAVLVVAALVSENFALSLPSFNVSMAFPLLVAAFVLDGSSASAVIAALCFTNIGEVRGRRPIAPMAFNFGQLVVSAVVGANIFLLSGGTTLESRYGYAPMGTGAVAASATAAVLAGLCVFLLNVVLTAYAVSAMRGCGMAGPIRAMLSFVPTQLALALVGVLMAQVVAIAPVALLLFLFPLVLARQVFQRYEGLRAAYLDTIRSLVGALEAKDPYTRGHSERVSEYARMIGEQYGMDSGALDRLQTSALLHDIGKLALSAEILGKKSPLDEHEVALIRSHPALGASMVEKIPSLRSLADNVRMHHERLDGTGYPAGASATEIPDGARILAVADAYDAMTTERAYRGAMSRSVAIAELRAGSGRQFDPVIVRTFIDCEVPDTSAGEGRIALASALVAGEVQS